MQLRGFIDLVRNSGTVETIDTLAEKASVTKAAMLEFIQVMSDIAAKG